jgi:hypothetical protein
LDGLREGKPMKNLLNKFLFIEVLGLAIYIGFNLIGVMQGTVDLDVGFKLLSIGILDYIIGVRYFKHIENKEG